MIVSQWLMKSAYEALVTPFTYLAVNYLKRVEREDYLRPEDELQSPEVEGLIQTYFVW